jgi:hypothetical protein
MPREESPYALNVTTRLAHAAMQPRVLQLVRRRWVLEAVSSSFCLLTSFMYHATQDWGTSCFLDELQWHRLDNIGALNGFSLLFVYLAEIQDPLADNGLKILNFFLAVVVQEGYPWDERYTFGPLLLFFLIPVVYNAAWARRVPAYDYRELALGVAALPVALLFFVRGLDDASDPYRMAHGMWHMTAGFSCYHLWRAVRHPTNDVLVQQLLLVNRENALKGDQVSHL